MPGSLLSEIPLTQLERLKFIERQLMWGRAFKARMVMERFGVSRVQAGLDFKQYQALFPKNVETYNPALKSYTPSHLFLPELSLITDDSGVEGSYLTHVPTISKTVKANTLSLILHAIQVGKGVELVYGSSSVPLGHKRLIYPTRILSTANRLHFRGYCASRMEYRDFVISRCLTKPILRRRTIELPEDVLWEQTIELELIINPSLSREGQELVAHDYAGQLERGITLPKAMLHYFLIDNNIPATPEQHDFATRNPWAYPLLVNKLDRFYDVLFNQDQV